MKKLWGKFRKRLHSGSMDKRQQRAMFASMAARQRLGPGVDRKQKRKLAKKQIKKHKLDVKRYKRGWAAGQVRSRIESLLDRYTTASRVRRKRTRMTKRAVRKGVQERGYA